MWATGKWDCIRAAVVVTSICYCLLLACSSRQLQLDVMSLPPLAVPGASLAAEQALALVAVEDPLALDANIRRLVDTYVERDARPEDPDP